MKKRNSTSSNASLPIRIRMYRVGFGDCFLVSFPVQNAYEHVLVDCGVHARGDIGDRESVV